MTDGTITNILMAGVGGQGTLLASEILSEVLMQAGHDVKGGRHPHDQVDLGS